MVTLTVNDKQLHTDAEGDTPLLWVLRDHLGLTGTKFGCGIAACGACTVLLDGKPVRSCVLPVSAVGAAKITTIEGLASDEKLHPVQAAWIKHQVPQCGYCQSGMILATAALLEREPNPTDEQINESITNICRCGTYPRIRKAIRELATSPNKSDEFSS